MSSKGYHDFLATLCLRPIDRGDIASYPNNASQKLFAPPSFLSGAFSASDDYADSSAPSRRSPTFDEKVRQYPSGGIAIYNWNAGPGVWWRFLKPDQPPRNIEG